MAIPVRPVPTLQMLPRGIRFFTVISSVPIAYSNDSQGNPTQWTYSLKELRKSGVGYGAWTTKGIKTWNGYNFAEDQNDGNGEQGNGVDHDGADYPTNFNMSAIPTGSTVGGVVVNAPSGTSYVQEVWILYGPNGEDGTC